MYLSRAELDPTRRSTMIALTSPQKFHFVVHRSQYFDPVIKIAGHPVGRTDIIFFFSAIGKDKDTGVLKISVDNTVDMDIFTDTCDACHQRTVATHYQFYLNSGCRGFVELFYERTVGNMVYFCQNIGFFPLFLVLYFLADESNQTFAHIVG